MTELDLSFIQLFALDAVPLACKHPHGTINNVLVKDRIRHLQKLLLFIQGNDGREK